MPMPPRVNDYGLWKVDEVSVEYISDNWVQFRCEHNVINGSREIKNVTYSLLDRLRGVDFDKKVETELEKFIFMLQQRNEKILRLRRKTISLKAKMNV